MNSINNNILFKEYTEEDEEKYIEDNMNKRKLEIVNIEQTLSEMLETLNEMNQTVANADEKLNQIQEVLTTSSENVGKGEHELQEAETEEKKISWRYTTLGASAGAIVVMTSPFDFGLGVLVSGIFIGGITGWFMK